MYKIVTKYALLGFRPENDSLGQAQMILKPIVGTPHDFETEEDAHDWALNNHDDMRHHREFVVLPVHHMVLTDPE
jgi:hypothetical protein